MHKNKRWKFITHVSLLHFLLGKINTHSDVFVYCIWIAEILQANLCDGSFPNPTGPLPVFHHSILRAKSKVQAQSDEESTWYTFMQSLSNVAISWAIHMPCINIHHAGHYQLEMVLMRANLPWLQWVTHCMDLPPFT